MTFFRRFGRLGAVHAAAATLAVGLVAVALAPSSPANAQNSSNTSVPACNTAVAGAPTGPATVSANSTSYGKILVIGSGNFAGCTLYALTSDRFHALTSAPFACSDNDNPLHHACDTILWPALLSDGAPIAGPGVDPTLLGTVTRTDVPISGVPSVQQVTYAGQPLYRFVFDETPGETEGANLFDPVTSPAGTWYVVDPSRGLPASGQAHLLAETAPLSSTGTDQTVLAASMNDTFSVFPNASFPVYTWSSDGGHSSACEGQCALTWQPVLTWTRPQAVPNVDQHGLGIIVRPDGTHQVTYNDQPLYLYVGDAYIQGVVGSQGINGAGLNTQWGVFNTIPLP